MRRTRARLGGKLRTAGRSHQPFDRIRCLHLAWRRLGDRWTRVAVTLRALLHMLTPGSRLGAYEVQALIGQGGMGEVYRAHDNRLKRAVALKVLPAAFAADAERLGRFEREAQVLASLNHPHIAAIYGVEDTGDSSALVMELVDGDTLANRIAQGPIPFDEALPIARQIAEALEAAHERGIIHRDLKPANVMLTPEGKVKVLDFGLAKALDGGGSGMAGSGGVSPTGGAALPPTITSPAALTHAGVVLGTAAYMSPEQARGRAVDKRTDMWAFGCVLYEMLSGRRAFDGGDLSDVIAAIMRDTPALDALPPTVPQLVRRLLRRCLEKDRGKRLDSAAAARLDIDEALNASQSGRDASENSELRVTRRAAWPWLQRSIVLLALVMSAAGGYWFGHRAAQSFVDLTHLELALQPAESLGPRTLPFERPRGRAFAITPDGTRVVFAGERNGTRQLYVRRLDAAEAVAVDGTAGAERPFFSPDGAWIGFLADGVIRKVPLDGGPAIDVVDLTSGRLPPPNTLVPPRLDFFGASWGEDGVIVFGRFNDGLWQVPAAGGETTRLTTRARGEMAHRLPHHLPGGRGMLLTVQESDQTSHIAVLPPGATEAHTIAASGTDGRYAPSGHIVFTRQGLLMAARFDLDQLSVASEPVAVFESVMEASGSGSPGLNTGAAQFDLARNGTLSYATGGTFPALPTRLVWVDRTGGIEPIEALPGSYVRPRLSPDGKRIVVAHDPVNSREFYGLRILDLDRGSAVRVSNDGWGPLWSRDGSQLFFSATTGLGRIQVEKPAAVERLAPGGFPQSTSPDGSTLVFQTMVSETGSDLWLMPLRPAGTPQPLLQTEANEAWAEISPDGRWLAYASDATGQDEVYVRPFPDSGRSEPISFNGGNSPLWSRDGRELFFMKGAGGREVEVWAVSVETGIRFAATRPRKMFSGPFDLTGGPTAYDISLDGKRFLMVERLEPPKQPVTRLHIVLNWLEELRRAQTAAGER